MKPLITVFTPTYNRINTLRRTYESLVCQDCKNFLWLIVDDGSQDGTNALVKEWQARDNGFEIQYLYKENGGMHTAHNLAYRTITTELNVCIDSDDKLALGAISKICEIWTTVKENNYAGIIGLDADFENKIIGTPFDQSGLETTLSDFYAKGGRGDKKLVYRTDVMQLLPEYPEFEGEKLVPLSYKYLLCDQKYKLYAINEILCNVEYQADGSTGRIWKQYIESARGFAEFRKLRMQYSLSKKGLLIDSMHYVSNSITDHNRHFLSEAPRRLPVLLMTPVGLLFHLYVLYRAERSRK